MPNRSGGTIKTRITCIKACKSIGSIGFIPVSSQQSVVSSSLRNYLKTPIEPYNTKVSVFTCEAGGRQSPPVQPGDCPVVLLSLRSRWQSEDDTHPARMSEGRVILGGRRLGLSPAVPAGKQRPLIPPVAPGAILFRPVPGLKTRISTQTLAGVPDSL